MLDLETAILIAGAVEGAVLVAAATWRLTRPPVPPTIVVPPASADPSRVDLNGALETVLVKSMDSQGEMLSRINTLNVENAKLAVEMFQRRSNRRAGQKRADTGKRNGKGQLMRNCRLCQNAALPDPMLSEIVEHATHNGPAPKNVGVRVDADAVRVAVDERQIQAHPDGSEVIECPECAAGFEHSHAAN